MKALILGIMQQLNLIRKIHIQGKIATWKCTLQQTVKMYALQYFTIQIWCHMYHKYKTDLVNAFVNVFSQVYTIHKIINIERNHWVARFFLSCFLQTAKVIELDVKLLERRKKGRRGGSKRRKPEDKQQSS